MKCDLCKEEIEMNFLNKIKGTYIRIDHERKVICNDCQSKYKDELKKNL